MIWQIYDCQDSEKLKVAFFETISRYLMAYIARFYLAHVSGSRGSYYAYQKESP